MAKQFAVIIGNTTPFIRVLKFTDGVPSVVSLPFATPVALNGAGFSPDGLRLIASTAVDATDCLRMWQRDTVDGEFTQVSLTGIPGSYLIYDVAFLNDKQIALMTVTQTIIATIHPSNPEIIDWQVIDTLVSAPATTGVMRISVADDRRSFYVSRSSASSSTTALRSFYRDGEDWIYMNVAGPSYAAQITFISDLSFVIGRAQASNSNARLLGIKFVDATFPTTVLTGTNALMPLDSTPDNTPSDSPTSGLYSPKLAVSPDKAYLLVPVYTAPYVLSRRVYTFRTPNYLATDAAMTLPTLPSYLNDAECTSTGLFLLAVNSNTVTTGRVRGFQYHGVGQPLTNDTVIPTLFSNWTTIPQRIVVSDVIDESAPIANIYNAGARLIASGDLDRANIKIALLKYQALFNPAMTDAAAYVAANAVGGSSWDVSGELLSNVGAVTFGSSTRLIGDPPAVELNDTGEVEFYGVFVYDAVNNIPLAYQAYDTPFKAVANDRLTFEFGGDRLVTFTPA